MAEVLLVEDERILRTHYAAIFEREGFSVRAVKDGEAALAAFAGKRPDVAVLDLDLPKVSGFRVCEEFRRAAPAMPIVVLTANDSDVNEVRSLGLGADDFCSKTEPENVIVAHIRRAAARAESTAAASAPPPDAMPAVVKLGRTEIDTATLVVDRGDGADRLTGGEWEVFRQLWKANGRPLSPEKLLDALRERGAPCDISVLYVYISGLRRKLGSAGELITSQRRVGYRLIR